jgi:CheY-like chemotaxis protein
VSEKLILLVEDEERDEELVMRALRKNGIKNEVVVAHDGQEALDYLFAEGTYIGRDHAQLPTVILLDLKLPKIDGLEVLRRIRNDEKTKLVPIVILTSSNEESDRLTGYDRGANSFVRKPIGLTEFSEAIRQLGLYWLMVNEPPPSGRS